MPPGPRHRENPAPAACAHCGSPVPAALAESGYCCAGCQAVAGLLRAERLDRYYDLAGKKTLPVGGAPTPRTHTWLEPVLDQAAQAAGTSHVCSVTLDVQGIHCAGCVWLMNETFRRMPGAVTATVNPAVGKVRLVYRKGLANLESWIETVERFGYRFGPSRKRGGGATASLTWRLGLCVALSMNVMLLSISFYFGLAANDEVLFPLFTWLSAALSTAVVIIGGQPFFRAAWFGLRRGVLALDLPMALGILLVYGASGAQVLSGRGGDLTYFDTLNVFVTLMVLGRWLQHKVIERNRSLLLEDDGAEGLFVRRLERDGPHAIRAPLVKQHDELLVAPGEIVPVDGTLKDAAASISCDWITGESLPQAVERGQTVPAGSFNAGTSALTVEARTDFADSSLSALLRAPAAAAGPAKIVLWDRLARWWSFSVLSLATSGFALWWLLAPERALDVTAALLVVTCPCAIGLSLPLARELLHTRLRRHGFFPRDPNLLEKLVNTRKVIFDKTGTLTLGRLELANPAAIDTLPQQVRDVAFTLAARSGHPVSLCIADALRGRGARWNAQLVVTEAAGLGLESRGTAGVWRLGHAGFALGASKPSAADEGTVLSLDGVERARFETREVLRADAAQGLRRLRDEGFEIHLLSGDQPVRVSRLARQLELEEAVATGGLSPEQKADRVAALDRGDTLFLGDGVNDTLAFDRANLAGTVAVDRPILPGKSHFFLLGEGLAGLTTAIAAARQLRQVTLRILTISVCYNVLAVAACLLGWMTPLRAAVSMPASSLALLGFTMLSLASSRGRSGATPALLREATCP